MISYDQYHIIGELPIASEFMDPMVFNIRKTERQIGRDNETEIGSTKQ